MSRDFCRTFVLSTYGYWWTRFSASSHHSDMQFSREFVGRHTSTTVLTPHSRERLAQRQGPALGLLFRSLIDFGISAVILSRWRIRSTTAQCFDNVCAKLFNLPCVQAPHLRELTKRGSWSQRKLYQNGVYRDFFGEADSNGAPSTRARLQAPAISPARVGLIAQLPSTPHKLGARQWEGIVRQFPAA